jgi:hypothetical protein
MRKSSIPLSTNGGKNLIVPRDKAAFLVGEMVAIEKWASEI